MILYFVSTTGILIKLHLEVIANVAEYFKPELNSGTLSTLLWNFLRIQLLLNIILGN